MCPLGQLVRMLLDLENARPIRHVLAYLGRIAFFSKPVDIQVASRGYIFPYRNFR